ncbi:MAG: DNA repair protein RecO [Candidatus Latescibacteria bacterium]|nr:DNA repair protein RecO [Candidatus Latescibacterota bacterium]
MSISQTQAIVLNRYVMGDSSLLVTVYTREFGKIKLVARGARKSKNQRASALEPFTHISITFRHKEQRDLQTLNQVEVVQSYRYLGEDLTRMSYAGAVSELVNRLVIGEEPSVELFDLILQVLDALNREQPVVAELLFWGFQLRFAMSFGYAPQFEQCVACGEGLQEESLRFSAPLGGMLCRGCRSQDTDAIQVSLGTVRMLARLQAHPLDRLSIIRPSRQSRHETNRVIRSFFAYHMDDTRELKSLRFLDSIDPGTDIASKTLAP